LITIIHVLCGLVNFALAWAKPQNCCTAIILDCNDIFGIEEVDEKELRGLENYTSNEFHKKRPLRLWRYKYAFWTTMLCVFGASHLIAWNFHFPTAVERWMWRGAALSVSAYPLLAFCYLSLGGPRIIHKFGASGLSFALEEGDYHIAASLLGIFTVVVISLARMYLVLEAFISLRALPTGAYEAMSWSGYLPHI